MTDRKIVSSLDITNWFFKKAESQSLRLSENKIQHLLFLTQMHFILKNGNFLSPTLFVCDNKGFFDPTIRSILSFGLPLMSKPHLSKTTDDFLELIWQKYGKQSDFELQNFVTSLKCYKQNCNINNETIINPMNFVDSFASSLNINTKFSASAKTKILISQNGPVRVSAWDPRKSSNSNKENNNNA